MTIEVSAAIVISLISVVFSIFFGLKNNKRSDTKEIEERVAERTEMNMKLDTINQNTNDIKYDLSAVKKDIQKHSEKIVELEQSTRSAHHRIDGIETRLNEKESNK